MIKVVFFIPELREVYSVQADTWEGVRLAAAIAGRKPMAVIDKRPG